MFRLASCTPFDGVDLALLECLYCALTLSTLLSSQVSGAHLALAFAAAWGNSSYFTWLGSRCQTEFLASPPARVETRILMAPGMEAHRIRADKGGFGAPIRPRWDLSLLRPCHRQRSMNITGLPGPGQIDGTPGRVAYRSTCTAPTVRLPRRTIKYSPASRSAGVISALGSVTRWLFR